MRTLISFVLLALLVASASAVALERRQPAAGEFLPTVYNAEPPRLELKKCLSAKKAIKNSNVGPRFAWFCDSLVLCVVEVEQC